MLVLAFLFLAVPFAEIAVLIAVGQRIGALETITLMVAVSVGGAFLAKRQGLETLRRIRAELALGRVPGAEVVDGLVILLAGALLLTPGFITDGVALVMLLPPARAGLRRGLRRRFADRVVTVRATSVGDDPGSEEGERGGGPPGGPGRLPPGGVR